MNKNYIFSLILVLVLVSFLGFCIENFFISMSSGFIDNRNMVLPFLWGYGLSILALLLIFGTPNAPRFFNKKLVFNSPYSGAIFYFFISFVSVCIGELVLGHIIEYTCEIIWWDYTRLPLHITRYTSVPTSFAFASMITLFMKYFFMPLMETFSKINPQVLKVLAICGFLALSVDMINSLFYMINNHEILKIWRIYIKNDNKIAIHKKC